MWLEEQGKSLAQPLEGSTNYLGAYGRNGLLRRSSNQKVKDANDGKPAAAGAVMAAAEIEGEAEENRLPPEGIQDLRPFPQNKEFLSERVTSEELREAVWSKVMREGMSVKAVSVLMGVEMSRVGAIVRLKEVEKQWLTEGKTLARPYAKAVLAMLPKTPYDPENLNGKPKAFHFHEPINDLPVHSSTVNQIWHPTSESRHFTRSDAARVFDEKLLPADKRVPHPELALLQKDRLAGVPEEAIIEAANKREHHAFVKKQAAEQKRREWEIKSTKSVDQGRWEFKFKEMSVDAAGLDGRGARGVGWRYGMPHSDRKRGQVKIPTRVA